MGHLRPLRPNDAPTPPDELDDPPDEPNDSNLQQWSWADVESVLDQMDPAMADILIFRMRDGMTQRAIARMMGLTQAAISWRQRRAVKAAQWLLARRAACGNITRDEMYRDLRALLDERDIEMAWHMYTTTCQTRTAEACGITQAVVNSVYARIMRVLAQAARRDPSLAKYFTAMQMLRNHWCVATTWRLWQADMPERLRADEPLPRATLHRWPRKSKH
jgi:predicted transcriptional regulator